MSAPIEGSGKHVRHHAIGMAALQRLVRVPAFWVLIGVFGITLAAPLIAPYGPTTGDPAAKLLPPSVQHLMGTDSYGFDVFSRVLYATRTDLPVAILSVVIAVLIGLPAGTLAGYAGGWFDEIAMRFTEIGQAFPQILFAMAIFAAFGNSQATLVGILVVLNVPVYLRMVRSVVMPLREAEYIAAARLSGNGTMSIVMRHAMPNALVPVFSQFSISAAFGIQLIAGLSFIGLGVRLPEPEWGSMISIGAGGLVFGQWWPSFFPGVAIAVTSYALIGVGNELRRIVLRER